MESNIIKLAQILKEKEKYHSKLSSLDDFSTPEQLCMSMDNKLVKFQSKEIFKLPQDKAKILGKNDWKEFNRLLLCMCDINNKHTGDKIFDVKIELNLNMEVIKIKNNLMQIMQSYCMSRVKKTNSKDKNKEEKYNRLLHELLPIIVRIILTVSLGKFFLEEIFYRVKFLFQEQIMETYNDSQDKLKISPKIMSLINEYQNKLKEMVNKIIGIKQTIYDKEYDKFEIGNQLQAKWHWESLEHNVGRIDIYNANNKIMSKYYINYKGILTDKNNSLIYYDVFDIEFYNINLDVLSRVWKHLHSFYTVSDRNQLENKIILDNENKKIAIVNNQLEENITTKPSRTTLKQYNITKNTIWNKFSKTIEYLGAVIKQGKGDDIKIYLKHNANNDAKIYRTSDPRTKKREILIKTQENILKIIGISPESWGHRNKT